MRHLLYSLLRCLVPRISSRPCDISGKCTGCPCRVMLVMPRRALQGERLMLVVERNPSNEDMWVILSGGVAKDTITVVRVRYIVLLTLVCYFSHRFFSSI
ncbi:hypothetical protein EDD16DRAFT_793080 [Pisolithus croceorrhizus]|nr:hypothetical protein EDD16DRAFT_793080 [Pisolithus croceorrhizus]